MNAPAVDMLDVYLKGYTNHQSARAYLTENDLRMRFSVPHKLYYLGLRPLLPIALRQVLQRRVNARKSCRANFIWPDLVDLVRRDDEAWSRMTSSLYPQGCETAIILTHDVETQDGFDFIPRIIELESAFGFRSSWNLVAHKYKLRPEIVDHIVASGHEIGIHGYNHDGTLYYSKGRFERRAAYINAALRKYHAVGFRSPQVHRDLAWLQGLDILYDASCFDYDPYQPFPGGTGSIWPFMAGKFVELPYTLPQDHSLFFAINAKDTSIWQAKTRWLVANRGMVLALTHPDYLKGPRLHFYEEFLAFLKQLSRAWHCLPREMAERYKALPA